MKAHQLQFVRWYGNDNSCIFRTGELRRDRRYENITLSSVKRISELTYSKDTIVEITENSINVFIGR